MCNQTVTTVSAEFAGMFDGQGHTISGINVTHAVGQSGIFGKVAEDFYNKIIDSNVYKKICGKKDS